MSKKTKPEDVLPDPAAPLPNARWEAVLQAYFKDPGVPLCDYCTKIGKYKNTESARVQASRMLRNDSFSARLAWLQKQTEARNVMTIIQRKELLSKIAATVGNAQICDYVEAAGGQGAFVTYGPDSPRQGAVKKLKTITMQDDDGNGATITTEIELHSPSVAISAIRELNEMEGAHAPAKVAQTDTQGRDVVPWAFGPEEPESLDKWAEQYKKIEKLRAKLKGSKK